MTSSTTNTTEMVTTADVWRGVVAFFVEYDYREARAAAAVRDDGGDGDAWGWVVIGLCAFVSCWSLVLVTEERFAPALHALVRRYEISDEFAGAVVMGVSMDAPEFFTTLVSVFVTKSSFGLGDVLGSVVFNQTVIVAASVRAAGGRPLKTDPRVTLREAAFFGAAVLSLLFVTSRRGTDEEGRRLFVVPLWRSLSLLAFYLVYAYSLVACRDRDDVRPEETEVEVEADERTPLGGGSLHRRRLSKGHTAAVLDEDHRLEEVPKPGATSFLGELVYCVVYQVKVAMEYTLPDVRLEEATAATVWTTVVSSLLWLFAGTYVMVRSFEAAALRWRVSEVAVGAALGAVGTSLPNCLASMVAAKKGYGDMAMSNVFGSNVFYLLGALGVSWSLCAAANAGPYEAVVEPGAFDSLLFALVFLLLHVALVWRSGFELLPWHAHAHSAMYLLYLSYTITRAWWGRF